jgi:hypothetical protein
MHLAVRHLKRTLAALAVPLLAIGCSDLPVDTSLPVVNPIGPSAQRSLAVAVTCTASVAGGSLTCARPSPRTGTFGPNFLIVGGQDEFVRRCDGDEPVRAAARHDGRSDEHGCAGLLP